MITPRIRSLVSLAAALAAALALAGCGGAPARLASEAPARSDLSPITVHFENYGRNHVHVYLVGERREWLLGRVEPLAQTRLRIPESALVEPGSMRLVVLAGRRATLRAADEARATITMAQPVTAMLANRWTFSESATMGHLAGVRLPDARAGVGRP